MYARTIVAYLIPGKADEAIRIFHDQVLPEVRQQPGYVSASIYVDREHNMAQTVSIWETAAEEASTSQQSAYLKRVVGMLRGCLVNRDYAHWEVGVFDRA